MQTLLFYHLHLLIKNSIKVLWKKSGLSKLVPCLALGWSDGVVLQMGSLSDELRDNAFYAPKKMWLFLNQIGPDSIKIVLKDSRKEHPMNACTRTRSPSRNHWYHSGWKYQFAEIMGFTHAYPILKLRLAKNPAYPFERGVIEDKNCLAGWTRLIRLMTLNWLIWLKKKFATCWKNMIIPAIRPRLSADPP